MNELEQIKSQLNEINNKRVRYQTLKEQAIKQCQEIEQKYNITSIEQLGELVQQAQLAYEESVQQAQKYIEETNRVFAGYQGVL